MKRSLQIWLGLLSIFFVLFPYVPSASAEPLQEVRELVRDYYVDEVPASVLEKKSVKELVRQLDLYSEYMSAKEYKAFIDEIESRFVGIGVVLEPDDKGVRVASLIPGGPAERAGIQPGDVITHVDGRSITGKSVEGAVSVISGAEKTSVTITAERVGQAKPFTIKLVREAINLPNVEYEMLGGEIGYVRLNSFATESAKGIDRAIRALPGAKGWIFDLRDNGGGYISSAQEVTGFFPKANQAFQLRERNMEPELVKTIRQPRQFTGSVHMLINTFSASASEMVAAAVKEQQAATIYGQPSYGKGTMQSLFEFKDGSALKLTTARFYSPGGRSIDQVGVKPHVLTAGGAELATSHRDQLLATLKGYQSHGKLKNVPKDKTFTVEMTKSMNWKAFPASGLQLFELGGKEKAVSYQVVDDKTVTVIPKEALRSGKAYLLVIHPVGKDLQNRQMKKGIYVEVTVK
ncbi:S41 family peptidase [Sporosarcina sp. 179-K 3D1 HS]|uniref:S41 family peptidase n=1 Tax=Sporosarcina sp. 179-K 3D1 HS TaxID=3232169 RepID=UPI0039A0537B